MLIGSYYKLARASIRASRWRSLLTMLGIIIGVVSVVTIVSIGEGVKHQVRRQVENFGPDLLIVRPGQTLSRDTDGNLTGLSMWGSFNGVGALTDTDIKAIDKAENVGMVAPMSLVNGVATYEDKRLDNGVVVATTANLPDLTNQTVDFGEFLTDHDEGRFFAVIGPGVAEQLFGENVPIGKSIDFRGQRFTVKGVMTKFDSTPFVSGVDFNNSVFISYATGKALSEGNAQVVQILVKPADAEGVDRTQASIESALLQTHGGQQDFSVLKQDETISAAGNILTILTALVAAVATISLVVGGIGVMNIMLVSVTERTQEIGIRKAVGATNHQILMQFLVESMVLSLAGGALGVLLALVINFVLRVTTSLEPVLSPIVIVVAMLMSLVVGVIFGVVPAMKAARKHPIDALRFE